jgi:proline iminopeptidase
MCTQRSVDPSRWSAAVAATIVSLALVAVPTAAQQVESLRVPGATLQYRSLGAGTPIVLVGGGSGIGAGYMWPIADGLAASGFHCVLYDQRGRGGSTAEALDKAHINVAASVADLEALRAHLGLERMTLLGHSWGAMLAAAYVAAHPERVDRLVLVGPGPLWWDLKFLEGYGQRLMARAPAPPPGSKPESAAATARAALRRVVSAMIADPQSALERRHFFLYAYQPENAKEWDLMQADLASASFDVRPHMARWKGKALIIQGRLDALGVEHAQSVAKTFGNGQAVIVDGASHYIWWDRPDEFFAAVVGFMHEK